MVVKTGVLLAWFALSYVLLVFVAQTSWQALPASLSLAMAMAGVGFSVQHDANHAAYSKSSTVNRGMGLTLDLLGASSYLWRFKHNVAHHTFTNLAGADDDINLAPFARVAPSQRHHAFHRAQHFYLWALYGFLMFKWHLVYDFKNLARGWVAKSKFPRPKGWSLVELVAGKLFFFGWAVALPLLFHAWWVVLVFYAVTSFVLGVLLSVVFQLAHCVEETDFPEVPVGAERMPARLGRAPGPDDGGLRAAEPLAHLVRGRAQLPDRAPSLPAHVSRPLPEGRRHRANRLPRARGAVHVARDPG
jgi:linoleoyl-CoA desaturase